MSSLSTPTRLGRGLVIPGIDTKPPLDKASTALSYGGLHTPPQSAHESRRPSLQYSTLSEAPYSASSFTYSQPATPVHGMHHGNDVFSQRWTHSADSESTPNGNLQVEYSTSPLADHSLQAPFEGVSTCSNPMIDPTATYPQVSHGNGIEDIGLRAIPESPAVDTWKPSHDVSNGYAAQNTCLGPNLFTLTSGMNVPANSPVSVFDQMSSSFSNYNYNYNCVQPNMEAIQGYSAPNPLYQTPQVVVPSQLSPQEDYTEQQLSNYTSPSRSHDAMGTSFASSSVSFGEYEMVRPPSPLDVYFAHSEDEEYLMVKDEAMNSPVGPSRRRRTDLPSRPKRRASRRLRNGNRTPLHRHEQNGCVIDCAGTHCCLEPLPLQVASNKKPFKCTFIMENGKQCPSRFDRSEHLKRHEGSHGVEEDRKYFCPLPKCNNKKIGRPDNAGDHFKTHLRPKKKGKRNDHYGWPEVHNAIWDGYEDKKVAKKLLDGLRRWINAGMPDTSGSRGRPQS